MCRFLVCIIFASFSCQSFAVDCEQRPFFHTYKEDGSKMGLFLSEGDFSDAYAWDVDSGEPPLPISTAIKIIKDWSKKFYNDFDDMSISSIDIRKLGCWGYKDNWVYIFSLRPFKDGNWVLTSSGYVVGVSMSGKVLEPRKTY